jgi:hypothetical protein
MSAGQTTDSADNNSGTSSVQTGSRAGRTAKRRACEADLLERLATAEASARHSKEVEETATRQKDFLANRFAAHRINAKNAERAHSTNAGNAEKKKDFLANRFAAHRKNAKNAERDQRTSIKWPIASLRCAKRTQFCGIPLLCQRRRRNRQ